MQSSKMDQEFFDSILARSFLFQIAKYINKRKKRRNTLAKALIKSQVATLFIVSQTDIDVLLDKFRKNQFFGEFRFNKIKLVPNEHGNKDQFPPELLSIKKPVPCILILLSSWEEGFENFNDSCWKLLQGEVEVLNKEHIECFLIFSESE